MVKTDKWFMEIYSEVTLHDVAIHSLRTRLKALKHSLRLAAEQGIENSEHVHALRVNARRSLAAIFLYVDLLPKKEAKWFTTKLRLLIRVAGKARDLDILAQPHDENSGNNATAYFAFLQRKRESAQKPLVSIYRTLKRRQCLLRHVKKLLKGNHQHNSFTEAGSFRLWASLQLTDSFERFMQSRPSDFRDLEDLHRFRICGKELRYAMELLASACHAGLRETVHPILVQLQDRLGYIHDNVVAIERFTRWAAKVRKKKVATYMQQLAERKNEQLKALLTEIEEWLTPEFLSELQCSFHRMVDHRRVDPTNLPNPPLPHLLPAPSATK